MKTNDDRSLVPNHLSDDRSLVPNHLSDDELLSYLDGEAGVQFQAEAQTHVESCWDCRTRLNSYERCIENFLLVRQRILPSDLPSSGLALKLFRERLLSHQSLTPSQTFLQDRLTRLRSLLRRAGEVLDVSNYPLRTQILASRGVVAVVVAAAAIGIALFAFRTTTVSASELLSLSIEARVVRIHGEVDPVVHQKVKVSRSRTGETESATWDVWNDTANSRFRSVAGSRAQTALRMSMARLLIDDLRAILKSSGMDDRQPISGASYRSWTNSLAAKTETVTSSRDENGLEILTITTVSEGSKSHDTIGEARIVFRAADYHPTRLHIKLGTPASDGLSFELAEDHFEIVSLRSVDPSVFSDPTQLEVVTKNGSGQLPTNSNTHVSTETNSDSNTITESVATRLAATAEAEVEVLDLLNKVGADISEQLNVTRTADGYLMVEGLVETDKRKSEILKALAPVLGDRNVRIKIQTIEEATLALQKRTQQSKPEMIDRIEIEKGSLALDPEFREHFARKGGDLESQIRAFSSRVANRSRSAVFQASALNRMSKRFTVSQIEALTPEARIKWLNILRGYAAAVRSETVALKAELEPVFGGFPDSEGESITNDIDLLASAKRLYELASKAERAVGSAFTSSNTGGDLSVIRSQQFKRNLADLEALATAIARAR